MAEPFIRVSDLRKSYQMGEVQVHALAGLDLTIARNSLTVVMGPSGSGKSTLLHLLGGLDQPTNGGIEVDGRAIESLNEDELAAYRRHTVGFIFQSFNLLPTMTALENVAVPLELAGRGDAFERAGAALRAVELGHRLGHYPAQLSGGEQQRVAIARAFAPEPELILADEPTGNLDSETGAHVMDLLFDLQAKSGATLMLITHDSGLAARCSRRVRLLGGRIAGDGADPGGAPPLAPGLAT